MMSGISRLFEKCQKCPFVDTCENKRMEALAYLPEPMIVEAGQSASMSAAAPVLRETMEIRVDGKTLTVYKDDIEKELYKSLYSGLGLQLGS